MAKECFIVEDNGNKCSFCRCMGAEQGGQTMVRNARGTISELGVLFCSLWPAAEIRDFRVRSAPSARRIKNSVCTCIKNLPRKGTSSIGVRDLPVLNCDGT